MGERYTVRARWDDEPGAEYAWGSGRGDVSLKRLLDILWVDRCIRRGWCETEALPTDTSGTEGTMPYRVVSDPPAFVVFRSDRGDHLDGDAAAAIRLDQAGITRDTYFTLRRADTGE